MPMTPPEETLESRVDVPGTLATVFRSDLDAMGLIYRQEDDHIFEIPAGYTGIRGSSKVFPFLFQTCPVTKGQYGKPFLKLGCTMFSIAYEGVEGVVRLTPGDSGEFFQTFFAQVCSTAVMQQDIIYSRPLPEHAFVVTYKSKLAQYNTRLGVKIASASFPKVQLLDHLEKDNTAKGQNLAALRAVLAGLPTSIKVELYLQKNNPRVAYLVFPGLKGKNRDVDRVWRDNEHNEKDGSGKALLTMEGLKVHPISLMTVNSWMFINQFFDRVAHSAGLPFKAAHINSMRGDYVGFVDGKIDIKKESEDKRNLARYGANYLKFVGEIDLKWVGKHRKALFDDDQLYTLFVRRESEPVVKPGQTYDEFYREAVRRARDDAQTDEKFALDSDAYHNAVNNYFEQFKRAGTTDI